MMRGKGNLVPTNGELRFKNKESLCCSEGKLQLLQLFACMFGFASSYYTPFCMKVILTLLISSIPVFFNLLHYSFSFFLKCVTQSLQDKIISYVSRSIFTIFLAMNFLMNKPSVHFPRSRLSFTASPSAPDSLLHHSVNIGLTKASKCQIL